MEIAGQSQNNKLLIYYIATSSYKRGFIAFKNNIHLFMPNMDKTVIVLSDGLQTFNDYEYNGVKYKVFHIDHYCWPIIALFKMTHILNHKQDCDFACYFNGDLIPNYKFNSYDTFFNYTKLNVSHHYFEAIKYNKNYDNTKYLKLSDDIPESMSYIGDQYYNYCQSGFFFGPSDIFFKMCEDISKWVEIDLRNNIIPKWHDETYLNKWCVLNKDLCHINHFMGPKNGKTLTPTYIGKYVIKPKWKKLKNDD